MLAPTPTLSRRCPAPTGATESLKIKERVTETLARHGVRIDPARVVCEEIYTPEDWQRRFGLYDGSAFGAAHTLFQVGPFRRKNFSEEMEGLYYVGASTTPGTGMPMVVLSGRLVAERIAEPCSLSVTGGGREVYFALHGWGGDRRTFAPLAPFVPDDASLYAQTCRAAATRRGRKTWTVSAVVEEIVESGARASIEQRVTLVGNCGGAVFALLAARELGDAVGRVSMIDPFAYLPRYFKLFNAGEFGRHAYDATFANPFGRWLTNQSLRGRRAGAKRPDRLVRGRGPRGRASLPRALRRGRRRANSSAGSARPSRSRTASGRSARSRSSLALWRDVLPGARVRELKGAGHLPLRRRPRRLRKSSSAAASHRTGEQKKAGSGLSELLMKVRRVGARPS